MTTLTTNTATTILTDRQERFIHEYLIDQNARAAARRAGYAEQSSASQARDLMRNPKVKQRIREALDNLFAELKITARNLLERQARIAFFDPRKLFDAAGNPVPLDQLDEATSSVLLVNYAERKNGDWTRRVGHPSRMQALIALEKRYLKYLELWGKAGEEDEEDQEDDKEREVTKAPAPVPARLSTPSPALAPAAVPPAAAAPPPVPPSPNKAVSLLRALWPSWALDKEPAAERTALAQAKAAMKAAKAKAVKQAAKAPPEIPFHMQFAHLDPPNLAALKHVPFEEWPEKARRRYKVVSGGEPLPAYLSKQGQRPLYGDPGPVFRDD